MYRGNVRGSKRSRATGGGVEQEQEKDKEEKPARNFVKMQEEEPWKYFKHLSNFHVPLHWCVPPDEGTTLFLESAHHTDINATKATMFSRAAALPATS